MRANRKTDSGPELALRSAMHRRGLRYRIGLAIAAAGIRVAPDVVFTRARAAVFVDGCFWHCCPEHGVSPSSNTAYWTPKLARNVERDRRVNAALRADGWAVIRVWEHEVTNDADAVAVVVAPWVAAKRRAVGLVAGPRSARQAEPAPTTSEAPHGRALVVAGRLEAVGRWERGTGDSGDEWETPRTRGVERRGPGELDTRAPRQATRSRSDGRLGSTQTGDLRNDEPDPVAGLATPAQLVDHVRVDLGLRGQEALEIECHPTAPPRSGPASRGGAVRRGCRFR